MGRVLLEDVPHAEGPAPVGGVSHGAFRVFNVPGAAFAVAGNHGPFHGTLDSCGGARLNHLFYAGFTHTEIHIPQCTPHGAAYATKIIYRAIYAMRGRRGRQFFISVL